MSFSCAVLFRVACEVEVERCLAADIRDTLCTVCEEEEVGDIAEDASGSSEGALVVGEMSVDRARLDMAPFIWGAGLSSFADAVTPDDIWSGRH